MLSLLFYGYTTGVYSSRKLEKATYDSIAFRYICTNEYPDHDSINTFRKRFRKEISELFIQILMIAKQTGWLKMDTVSLDGTKMKANASKHKALSYKHACKLEKQLKAEIEELLKMAETAEAEKLPKALCIPDGLKRREDRLQAIADAKAEIERRAEERCQQELAEHQEKVARPEAIRDSGEKTARQRTETTNPRSQRQGSSQSDRPGISNHAHFQRWLYRHITRRLWWKRESGLIVGNHVTQATNDKQQVVPALEELPEREEAIGKPDKFFAGTGYFSQRNVTEVVNFGATPYIAEKRDAHNKPLLERFKPDQPMPEGDDVTELDLMRWRLQTREGREVYAVRKSTVEPTFGIQKEVMGYRQFLVRGLEAVSAEWDLLCMCFNLKKMFCLMLKDLQKGEADYGFCASKKKHFYGFQGHLLVEARGIPVGFTLTTANIDERDAAYDIMEIIAGLLLGDKGYIRPEFKNDCQELGIDLQTQLRKNMKDERPKSFVKLIMRVRCRIETVIGQLAERFEMEKCRCRDIMWHMTSRIARKLLAHNIGSYLNISAGKAPIQFENLIAAA